jgi:hypothetical protein
VVRRSVANNLNDLGKVYPKLLVQTCSAWMKNASPERRALIEHALRSAVKRGEAGVLALLGFGKKASFVIEDVEFAPRKVKIGGRVSVAFTIRSTASSSRELLIDLAVHFVKANGKTLPKVFKLKRITIPTRGKIALATKVSLAIHTTRKPHPGKHDVDVIVNGQAQPIGGFEVLG